MQKAGNTEQSSTAIDYQSQHHTHTTAAVTSQGTDTIEIINELYASTKTRSHDSVLQHNNSRSLASAVDYDVIITPNPSYAVSSNMPKKRKPPKQEHDYGDMELAESISLNDDAIADPASNDDVDIEPNPSYSLQHHSQDFKMQDNPSYNKLHLYN